MNEPVQDATKVEPSFEEQLNRDAQQHAMTVYDQTLRAQRNSANDAICQYESMVAELRFKLGKLSEKRQAEQAEAAVTIADLTARVADLEARLAAIMTPPPASEVVTSAPPAPAADHGTEVVTLPVTAPAATDPVPARVPAAEVVAIPAVHVIQAIDAPKSDGGDTAAGVPAASDASAVTAG